MSNNTQVKTKLSEIISWLEQYNGNVDFATLKEQAGYVLLDYFTERRIPAVLTTAHPIDQLDFVASQTNCHLPVDILQRYRNNSKVGMVVFS